MSEHKEPIPSMIYNASIGGHVTSSQQIIDENENKEQSQINAEIKQTFTTLADNEDITRVDDGTGNKVLKFADRTYNANNFSGKGYKILRKNMTVINIPSATITVISTPTTDGYISVTVDDVEMHINVTTADTIYNLCEKISTEIKRNFDKFTVTYTDTTVELIGNYEFTISDIIISEVDTGASFGSTINENIQKNVNLLTQDMMPNENTVYVLRYDYELNNTTINIPANSVLEFRGGKISNGQINFSNTHIATYNNVVFSNIYFSGFYTNESVKISWFTNGMSSKSDYSNNHAKMLKSAMQMATLLNKWVDLEKLPLLIKGEVFLDEKYGNCGLRNGNIYFISEKENDCTLRYVQTKIYTGSYAPIIDTYFQYIGDGNGNLHANVSCIYKDNWSDTVYTYWRDIKCFGYTGYFMVNTTYLQEVTFTNIYLSSTFGFITYNTQGIWGEKKGTSNIVKFLNCNLNNAPKRIKPKKSEAVKYIWDFYQPMEISLENIVNQGRISDEVGEKITVIRIEGNHNNSTDNCVNCVLNGFWIEYVSNNTYNNIILENANVYLTLKKRNCEGIDVRGICRGVINFEQAEIQSTVSFLNNVLIEDLENSRLSLNINASLKAIWFNLNDNTIDLIERGIIRVLNFYINNWREASVNVNITPAYKFDVKKHLLSLVKPTLLANRGHTGYITNENNVTILCYENNSASGYSEYAPLWGLHQYLLGHLINKIDFIKEIIYRATLTVDVTEDNINDIKCGFTGFISPSEGLPVYAITPEVGMKAGTTTGWIRNIYCGYSSHTEIMLNLRYARIEIAKMVITSGTTLIGNDDDDVLFNTDNKTIMRRNVMPETYYIGVDSKNDNEAYMNNIIKNAPIQDIFITDKNVYRWNGNKIKNVANNSGETSERPTNIDIGTNFYDITLNKPIWWNGTSWVDVTGTTV